jgi:hypothetical protein
MAATVVEQGVIPIGQSEALVFGTITFDSTYPAGGEVIDAPVSERDYEFLWPAGCTTGGYVPVYDSANRKLKMYSPTTAQATGLTETSTTDLSAQVVSFGAIRPK